MKKCNLDGNLLDAVAMASEILGHDIGENVVLVVDSADADETGDETSAFEDELEEDQKAIAEFYASSDDDEVEEDEEDDTGDDVMYIIVTRKSRRANTRAGKAREKRAVAKNARIASLNTKKCEEKDKQNHTDGQNTRVLVAHKLEKRAETVTGAKKHK